MIGPRAFSPHVPLNPCGPSQRQLPNQIAIRRLTDHELPLAEMREAVPAIEALRAFVFFPKR